MALLEIRDLTFTYPSVSENVFRNVSLRVEEGEFIVLTGATGTGKTTLLRLIKKGLAPHGTLEGKMLYDGRPLSDISDEKAAADIGYVFQDPESQIVAEYVWGELAFGLENMRLPTDLIRRRIGEIAGFFGISDWFFKKTNELSGGEKQLLNLAAVIAMKPKLLLLDEPTSRLDPLAREKFLNILKKLHEELALSIILVEHGLEEIFPLADRIMVLTPGGISFSLPPAEAAANMPDNLLYLLPAPALFYHKTGSSGPCPLSVRDGQSFLRRNFRNHYRFAPQVHEPEKEELLRAKDLWFRYERRTEDVLRGLDLSIKKGEILSILGANGSGKTTLLKILAGVYKPYRGKIKPEGIKKTLLPQNPESLFLGPTVNDDLKELSGAIPDYEIAVAAWTEKLNVRKLLHRNFYDLSGGEKQKIALLKIFIINSDIIMLDEPTKGLDGKEKQEIAAILRNAAYEGKTIVIVTHDIEFSAWVSNRVGLLFSGEIVAEGPPVSFFADNYFYTTSAARISRDYYDNTVKTDDLVWLAGKNGRT